ncbi:DUF3868 domain-containing protein [Phocaeicola vulgatus]|nr:DUF3868 domain-containing protein [Phocaeicola vulgatus]
MIKSIFIGFGIFFSLLTASSQTNYLSAIQLRDLKVEKTKEKYTKVRFIVDFRNLKLNKQHSIKLIPYLISKDKKTKEALPAIVFNGKIRDRAMKKKNY